MPDFITKEQLTAQEAYSRVQVRQAQEKFADYKSFALSFPSLIHSCGLVQALSFAASKKKNAFIDDLQAVFDVIDNAGNLLNRSREAHILEYMRITRHAISAASWIKRYCQAVPDNINNTNQEGE